MIYIIISTFEFESSLSFFFGKKNFIEDIKEHLNTSKSIWYQWIGRLNIVNMSILPKIQGGLKLLTFVFLT